MKVARGLFIINCFIYLALNIIGFTQSSLAVIIVSWFFAYQGSIQFQKWMFFRKGRNGKRV